MLRRSLANSCKLALVSLPLILLAWLLIYLSNKLHINLPAGNKGVASFAPGNLISQWSNANRAQSLQWPQVALAALRFLIFAVVLPLACVRLWLETLRGGVRPTLKTIHLIFSRAFAPQFVSVYAVGFLFFAVLPYFLLFTNTHAAGARIEFGVLILRLLLVFFLTLFGWIVTVAALVKLGKTEAKEVLSTGESSIAEPRPVMESV